MGKGKYRLLAAAIGSFTVIAGVTAYFTGEDSISNLFKPGTLDIRITEPSWSPDPVILPEEMTAKDPYIENIDTTPAYVFMEVTVPAASVSLEDASGSDKGRLDQTVYAPLFRFVNTTGTAPNETDTYTADPTDWDSQTVNPGWYPLSDKFITHQDSSGNPVSYTYFYAYTGTDNNTDDTMTALAPGTTTTTPLFDKVLMCNAREDDTLPGSRQVIEIKIYGIQSDHLTGSDTTVTKAETVWQYLAD